MEKKKTDRANLELRKSTYYRVGLIIALALTIFGFEYRTYEKVRASRELIVDEVEEEEIPITEREEKPPPPPPPPPPVIEIVEDEIVVEEVEIVEVEVDEDTEIEIQEIEIIEEEEAEPEIFAVVEEMPSFPGGTQALINFMTKNVQYPAMARENDIQGKVYISFAVDAKGNITKATVKRGIGGGCDEEALRVVKSMPKWNPGKQRNKPVSVWCTLPVNFGLK